MTYWYTTGKSHPESLVRVGDKDMTCKVAPRPCQSVELFIDNKAVSVARCTNNNNRATWQL